MGLFLSEGPTSDMDLAGGDRNAGAEAPHSHGVPADSGTTDKGMAAAADVAADIIAECDAIKAMLLEKNAAYGNSALDPLRIFSTADAVEQIRVRIDDKLSRIARGHAAGEDVTADLIGYLVLLRVAQKRRAGCAS